MDLPNFTTTSRRRDKEILKRNTVDLNSEFFFYTGCLTKAKELNMSYCCNAGRRSYTHTHTHTHTYTHTYIYIYIYIYNGETLEINPTV